jgi:hypothetical protein
MSYSGRAPPWLTTAVPFAITNSTPLAYLRRGLSTQNGGGPDVITLEVRSETTAILSDGPGWLRSLIPAHTG